MKKKLTYILYGILIEVIIFSVFSMILVSSLRRKNNKVDKYDLNCITSFKSNPLKECKYDNSRIYIQTN